MLKKAIASANNQNGFTLIEVLVAVIILAIGLLGLANLQTLSIRNNLSAYLRTQATWLADNIISRIRSNTVFQQINCNNGLQNYTIRQYTNNYNGQTTANCPDPTKGSPNCTANYCDSQQIIQKDICEWATAIREILPGDTGKAGNGGIVCIGDINLNGDTPACTGKGNITPGAYSVAIWWHDPVDNGRQVFLTNFQIALMPGCS
jgi:type IV pilus assembly protein PilV